MIDGQLNIFDVLYPKFKIDKPIRLIELFGGYGSQALALKYLGVKFEHWKLCEWAVKSIQAYKDIHMNSDNQDYSKDLSKEELIDTLYNLGISQNYNEPMTYNQVKRLGENQLRTIYNNIKATNNLVNIQQVKGADLDIKETNKYCYVMTYSFPCQDLSLAGNRALMSDTSTRSGLLWEVERILTECKEKPQVLLMENVPQVHGEGALQDFIKWQNRLEELGYKNYWQDLIATDYGIPQTRNRCFMVSILGEYNYTFPKPIPLKLKLKDLLESNVPEKYFLSERMIDYIYSDTNSGNYNRLKARESCDRSSYSTIDASITTCAGQRPTDNFIQEFEVIDSYNKKITNNEYSGTIVTRQGNNQGSMILIKNNNSKGYLEATEGDGIDISSRMQFHRGNVQKNKSQTITTMGGENVGVLVNE